MAKRPNYTPRQIGGLPEEDGGGDTYDRSDYVPVPASDKGNSGYTDRGMRGFYQTSATPFHDPPGVKHFTGYGADDADLDRGYKLVPISDDAAYQLEDYKYRNTEPKLSDIDEGGDGSDATMSDFEFRRRNRQSRGFLTRPHIPTDR